MDVLIAGGHGKIARRLIRLLAREGHTARGLIRNPDHAADIEADGGIPVLCDLERDDVTPHVRGADAIVFAAGAGPGSGPERKQTVDYGAAVKCVEAAEAVGVRRFVIISSIGAHDPEAGPEPMRPYLRAKAAADARVAESSLDWTIVRPGSLTDDPGTGLVDVSTELGRSGPVPRDDVALVLAETLEAPNTIHLTFEVFQGDVPVREAVRALGAGR
jgi:nucleoside-diphosphate-sugar epimerase